MTIGKSSRIRRALMAIVIFALSFFMNFTFGLLRVAILLVFLIVFLFSARMVCEWDARDRNSLGWGFIFGNSLNLGLFLGGSAHWSVWYLVEGDYFGALFILLPQPSLA